jgi:hypothetical protein
MKFSVAALTLDWVRSAHQLEIYLLEISFLFDYASLACARMIKYDLRYTVGSTGVEKYSIFI